MLAALPRDPAPATLPQVPPDHWTALSSISAEPTIAASTIESSANHRPSHRTGKALVSGASPAASSATVTTTATGSSLLGAQAAGWLATAMLLVMTVAITVAAGKPNDSLLDDRAPVLQPAANDADDEQALATLLERQLSLRGPAQCLENCPRISVAPGARIPLGLPGIVGPDATLCHP